MSDPDFWVYCKKTATVTANVMRLNQLPDFDGKLINLTFLDQLNKMVKDVWHRLRQRLGQSQVYMSTRAT
eukprot:3283595-Rhodomonas_salina.2